MAVMAPYVYCAGKYSGWTWKIVAWYAIYRLFHAIYDVGVFMRFFIYGPSYIKSILELDPQESFASI